MFRVGKLLQRDLRLVQRMSLPEHAQVALPEQAVLEESGLQLRQQTHRNVDMAGFHFIPQIDGSIAYRTD